MSLFKLPVISRIRRNHGLEHATINVLVQRNPYLSLVGRSDWKGFVIVGEVETEDVESAAREAFSRLQAGESQLALHPRCGTMLATTGVLSGMAAFFTIGIGRSRSRFRWANLPEALIAATFAALVAQPLGFPPLLAAPPKPVGASQSPPSSCPSCDFWFWTFLTCLGFNLPSAVNFFLSWEKRQSFG